MALLRTDKMVAAGTSAAVLMAAGLGWNSREPWGMLLISGTVLTLLLSSLAAKKISAEKPFPAALLLFALATAIATALSSYVYGSLLAALPLLTGMAAFYLGQQHFHSARRQRWLAATIVITGVALAVDGLRRVPGLENPELGIASVFVWKNAYAGWLAMTLPIAVGLAAVSRRPLFFWLNLVGVSAIAAALFFTSSQAGWLAAGVGISLVIAATAWQRRGVPARALLGLLVAVLGSAAIVGVLWRLQTGGTGPLAKPAALTRIAGFIPESTSTRQNYWKTTLKIIADYPWYGVGPGNFTAWYPHYFTQPWLYTISPHNVALLYAATLGVPATLLLFIFLGQIFWRTVKAWIRERSANPGDNDYLWVTAWAGGALTGVAHALLDLTFEVPAILLLWWLLLGVMHGHHFRNKPELPVSPAFRGGMAGAATALLGLVFVLLIADNAYRQAVVLTSTDAPQRYALLRRSLFLMPLSAATHEVLAQHYWEMVTTHNGNREENLSAMIAAARRAAELQPASAHRQWILGQAYYLALTPERPYWPSIIDHLTRAIAYDFHDPTYYRTLAEAYLRLGWLSHAQATIQTALDLYPEEELRKITFGGVIYEQLGLKERLDTLRGLLRYTGSPSP
ncbi:MAG: O-antigen polymerase [Parcubacteria group bacterium Gr01-1014_31]|nr:MAG: O-antigen polymerase [Parcubacteria group bacterium Gr01-1014_31]